MMKTKYQNALIVASLILAGCSNEEMYRGVDPSTLGQVVKPGVEVNNAEKVVRNMKSRASYDISNYIVDFFAVGQDEPYATYTYSTMPGTVELPVGNYTVTVRSHEVQKAQWDAPYFKGTSSPFTITAGELTEVEPIKCVFSSLKVSIEFGEQLRKVMGGDVQVTVVANDEGRLVYTPSETRAGYFEVLDGSVTLVATFEGTVNGHYESFSHAFAEVAKGQHRIITYEVSGRIPQPSQPSGNVDHSGIGIDMTYTDENLDGTVSAGGEDVMDENDNPGKLPDIPGQGGEDPGPGPDDPVTPPAQDGAISFGGTLQNGQTYQTTGLSEYTVVVNAENGIADMQVQIISTDGLTPEELKNVGLSDKFSLVTDEQFFEGLSGLGFPVGDEVKDQTSLTLNITEFMPLLQVLGPNTAKFIMTVTDNAGNVLPLEFTIVNP